MARPRFYNLPEEKRWRIIDAAGREFSEQGFEDASLNRIIAEAGVSKGAIYYYFDDKADVFLTAFELYAEMALSRSRFDLASLTVDNYWDKLGEFATSAYALLEEHPDFVGLGKAYVKIPKRVWADAGHDPRIVAMMAYWVGVVEKGQTLGLVRDDLPPELMARLWYTLGEILDTAFFEHWEAADRDQVAAHLELSMDILRRVSDPREA